MYKFIDSVTAGIIIAALLIFATDTHARDLTNHEQGVEAKAWMEAYIKQERDKNPKGFDERMKVYDMDYAVPVYVIIIENREVQRGIESKSR